MSFNSLEFLAFLPAVLVLSFSVPPRYRWTLLLGASYAFYMSWTPEYGLLLFAYTIVAYATTRFMPGASRRGRKALLCVNLLWNLGILFAFKFFALFSSPLGLAFARGGGQQAPAIHELVLPVGISFYTFQILSYTFDVYSGRQPVERHFGRFALYVAFFPQLVAGPIGRPQSLLPQFSAPRGFDPERLETGLRLMLWGFFKKLVIADRVALIVNAVYNDPTSFTGVPLVVATYLFAVQIYCDFSGYSDIAIGAARTLGYDLTVNFRQPYFSSSIAGFWQRWHISLSTWLRDYLFLPLAYAVSRRVDGDRFRGVRTDFVIYAVAIFVTMVACGIWHGSGGQFLLWGMWHGCCLAVHRAWAMSRLRWVRRVRRWPAWPLVAGILTCQVVCLGWVFFRANSVADALYILQHLLSGLHWKLGYGLNVGGPYELAIIGLSIAAVIVVDALQARGGSAGWFDKSPLVVRWAGYYAVLFGTLILGKLGSREFIYFKF